MKTDGYTNRTIRHSLLWVNGYPKHNYIDNECVSDFSCCHPDLFTTDQNERMESHKRLLKMLLGEMVEGVWVKEEDLKKVSE